MGGGAVPIPATTAGNHHSNPLYSPTVSSNFSTGDSDFIVESEKMAIGYLNLTNFGHVPSRTEVQNAIYDLQRVMNGYGEIMEQWNYDDSTSVMKSLGQKRLLDAYHHLQTDPFVQRLVLSISSDIRVWDAILKNDAVQDLRGSLPLAEADEECATYMHEPNSTSAIVKWIFAVMKSKIIQLVEKLEVFVFETLYHVSKKTTSTSKHDILEEKVRSSLLLSIVVLVIVVVTRSLET
ncbi:hypothetical protein HanRHA438_Chr13g0624511 [Helianthus annuus]|uniref:Uncharacterized protein n=1 Tax=Helianthus annuus TaxID=4232 RepID=A0A251SWT5_HELAN|nr:uncharacterized protein LOC110900074 isoform X1 [Helianthus annuus]KAF5775571.1 hypothetical protein HanXRQr2_Chr13g0613541 [Helianthus annuus]KAJ0478673.1 hypothetical protein HanHA300_Chr13g0502591 [Helianthus annuus]KAJ0499553.1 hypothetical protein HanHA89_Chr13g0535311 [Helianthus annuus]KAJ0665564.1 hypothetical protein HanLR1_Chr13g0505271 [Helianthus annuus]KAJ0673015.1 hypothetical protein HanOQP8_Chr13g0503521 [Helianthus annuus]